MGTATPRNGVLIYLIPGIAEGEKGSLLVLYGQREITAHPPWRNTNCSQCACGECHRGGQCAPAIRRVHSFSKQLARIRVAALHHGPSAKSYRCLSFALHEGGGRE